MCYLSICVGSTGVKMHQNSKGIIDTDEKKAKT